LPAKRLKNIIELYSEVLSNYKTINSLFKEWNGVEDFLSDMELRTSKVREIDKKNEIISLEKREYIKEMGIDSFEYSKLIDIAPIQANTLKSIIDDIKLEAKKMEEDIPKLISMTRKFQTNTSLEMGKIKTGQKIATAYRGSGDMCESRFIDKKR